MERHELYGFTAAGEDICTCGWIGFNGRGHCAAENE